MICLSRKSGLISVTSSRVAKHAGGLEDRPRPGKPRTTDDVAIVLATLETVWPTAARRAVSPH